MSTARNGDGRDLLRGIRRPERADPSPGQRPRVTVPELRRGVVPALLRRGLPRRALRQPRRGPLDEARRRRLRARRHGRRRHRRPRRHGGGQGARDGLLHGRHDRAAARARPHGPPALLDVGDVPDRRAGLRRQLGGGAGLSAGAGGAVPGGLHRPPGGRPPRLRVEARMARRRRHPGPGRRRLRPLLLSRRRRATDDGNHARRLPVSRAGRTRSPHPRHPRQPGHADRPERRTPNG